MPHVQIWQLRELIPSDQLLELNLFDGKAGTNEWQSLLAEFLRSKRPAKGPRPTPRAHRAEIWDGDETIEVVVDLLCPNKNFAPTMN